MEHIWLYSIISVVVVSLVSLIGIFTLGIGVQKIKKWMLYFISFAAGAMLGDAFLHLLPEALNEGIDAFTVSAYALAGIVLFFLLEKVIFWRHCHVPTSDNHPHALGKMNLIGDGLHNFIDGVIIAGSFLISPALGVTTALAVLLHEIPQEVGDFSILIHAGYTKQKALLFNLFSASLAIVGAVLVLAIGDSISSIASALVPFTIGGFIYIAAADLLPEIHREENTKKSFLQLSYFLLGIGLMWILLFLG